MRARFSKKREREKGREKDSPLRPFLQIYKRYVSVREAGSARKEREGEGAREKERPPRPFLTDLYTLKGGRTTAPSDPPYRSINVRLVCANPCSACRRRHCEGKGRSPCPHSSTSSWRRTPAHRARSLSTGCSPWARAASTTTSTTTASPAPRAPAAVARPPATATTGASFGPAF